MITLKDTYRIENAIKALTDITDWNIELETSLSQRAEDGYLVLDNHRFLIETKTNANAHTLQQLLSIKKQASNNFIFITETLSDNIKTWLRENDINYLDIAGNAFIQSKGIRIFVDGKKNEQKTDSQLYKNFTKKGIVIIFHFLRDESLLNEPYRKICEVTGTSLDTLSQTIHRLKQQGFIRQLTETTICLNKKEILLEKWVEEYGNRLKPSLFLGKFRFQSQEMQQNWQKITFNSQSFWGGEAAADLLTHFLVPSDFILYTSESQRELMQKYRIFPDKKGNIEAYQAFYEPKSSQIEPILVYADLMNSQNARNMEVAQIIKKQYANNFR